MSADDLAPPGNVRRAAPTSVLVSRAVAASYGERIAEIFERCDRSLQLRVFALDASPPPAAVRDIEVAFYSRDVWEGSDKTAFNRETQSFFAIVDAAPCLRWLQVTSAGADLPIYQPALQRGVRVTTSSGSNAEPIAHTVVAAVLALARGMPRWLEAQRRREWKPLRAPDLPRDLRGQTAVIIGTGAIGTAVASLLRVFGLTTVGVRRTPAPTAHFDEVTTFERIDAVLPRADWVVIACPLTPTTHGLVDARRLALLPKGAHVVNVARGEIVDESALIAALAQRWLAGAYLDVFATEPLPRDSPIWDLPNVIVTPHNCSASIGNHGRGVEIFLRNLARYLGGRALENEVARPG